MSQIWKAVAIAAAGMLGLETGSVGKCQASEWALLYHDAAGGPRAVEAGGSQVDVGLAAYEWIPSPSGRWMAMRDGELAPWEVVDMLSMASVGALQQGAGDVAWSPEEEQVAYQLRGRVVVARRDGSEPRELVRGMRPQWHPAEPGRIIYQVREPSSMDTYHIWSVDIETGESRLLVQEKHIVGVLKPFSPDGSRLLVSGCADGSFCVQVLDLASGSVSELLGPAGRGGATVGSWSPDGERLALTTAEGRGGLYVADVNTGESSLLIEQVPGGAVWGAAWHPEGGSIAFAMKDADGTSAIYHVELDGRSITRVADCDSSPIRYPIWWRIPDGSSGPGTGSDVRPETWGVTKDAARVE